MEDALSRKPRRLAFGMLMFVAGYMTLICVAGQVSLGLVGGALEIGPTAVSELYFTMVLHGVIAALSAIAAIIVHHRPVITPRCPRVVLTAVIVLLLVSVDRMAAVVFPSPGDHEVIFAPHAERGWFHAPNMIGSGGGRQVRTNSLGLRSPEIPMSKKAGEFRVLFIGDSITYGYGLRREDIYVTLVERQLRRKYADRTIHAINGGVCGYTTWQELHLLRNEGMRLDPDLVILTYDLNDMADMIGLAPGEITGRPTSMSTPNDSHWSGFVRAFRTVRSRRRANDIHDAIELGRDDPTQGHDSAMRTSLEVYREPPLACVVEAWRKSLEHLDEVDRFCQMKGIPWVLIYCPIDVQLGPEALFERPEWRLREWAQEKGVPYLDVADVFELAMAESGGAVKDYVMDSFHPSVVGGRVIADAIVQLLEDGPFLPFAKPDAN